MVARIAPEPINTNVAVTEYRSRSTEYAAPAAPVADDLLPPVPAPVPTPVPAPAIVPPSQAFAAALAAARLPARAPDANEFRLRQSGNWQAPQSSLRLTDRKV